MYRFLILAFWGVDLTFNSFCMCICVRFPRSKGNGLVAYMSFKIDKPSGSIQMQVLVILQVIEII
jgi:hypothetical protein